jgi:hypothetical protein
MSRSPRGAVTVRRAGVFADRGPPRRGRQAQSGQAPSDPNRDVWGCPPNSRNRTQAIAPATAGQMAGAPARATKSPSISAMTTTANAIMGASRMGAATTAADAQFCALPHPKPFHIAGET